MDLPIIYQDQNLLVINKPAGISVYPEEKITAQKTIIEYLVERDAELKKTGVAPRYGIVHRLDKDTSGVLLVAKTNGTLHFLQQQFQKRTVGKKYLALVIGRVQENEGVIETLIGRAKNDPRKQRAYLPHEPGAARHRIAITTYRVMERFAQYTLLEATPKTGRRHQIRCHLAYRSHPIAGDNVYGFKGQPTPPGLTRQFLHATFLKAQLLDGETKEFYAELPDDLKSVLDRLE